MTLSTRSIIIGLAAVASAAYAPVKYAGVNIAGCDFGCDTNGNCNNAYCPTNTGPSQISHFTSKGLNTFRFPVGWQYLVNYQLGGTLYGKFMPTYDALLDSCVHSSATLCIIDIHNYARWNGNIIGQSNGAVTDDHFVSLWTQLAQRYARTSTKIAFGIMNEPHDVDINIWGATVQKVVTAIRNAAGNNANTILLPGTDWQGVSSFVDNSLPALSKVKNPDGSFTNLIYDLHQYYDYDTSGTHAECVSSRTDKMNAVWTKLTKTGRQVLLTETGGGNVASCQQYVCGALDWMNYNSDVWLGWVGWAAGNFDNNYVLSETPFSDGTDTALTKSCIIGKFPGANGRKREISFEG